MDILKSLSIIGLLTMIIYFIMVNVYDSHYVKTKNIITSTEPPTTHMRISNALPDRLQVQVQGASQCLPPQQVPILSPTPPSWDKRNLMPPPLHAVSSDPMPKESNSDLFEKIADFGSDVTNINQFYKNNPEIFNRVTNVSINPEWDNQQFINREPPNQTIQGWNFERNFTSL
jgi:hypothetical protein